MRHVSYATGGSSECYVTFLGPGAGDWRANVVRWVGQIGAAPLSEADYMAMPTIQVMGKPAGLLLCIGITADELLACRQGRRGDVEDALKNADVYPYTDLYRQSALKPERD